MQVDRRPIGVDLFSGAGGMSLGFEQAGFDTLASVEIDPVHCCTHKFNFPYSKVFCKDIADVTAEEIRKSSNIGDSEIDVVFGGLPCQGFSIIGKQDVDDPRNTLAEHFVKLVIDLKAKFFVIENVRGLTFKKNKRILDNIINTFRIEGYEVASPQVINAAQYGVPQNRERLFLLGCKKGLLLPKYPTATSHPLSCSGELPTVRPTDGMNLPFCPNIKEAIGDLLILEKYSELLERDWVEAEYGKPSEYSNLLRNLKAIDNDYSYKRKYNSNLLTSNLRPKHSDDSVKRFGKVLQGTREPVSHFHKLHPQGISPTLRAGTARNYGSYTAARPIHPLFPRCITVREAARLHSYPDWFRFHITNWHGLRQVGNSVPPLFAKAVASEVMNALGVQPIKPQDQYKLGEEELLRLSLDQAAKHFGADRKAIKPRTRKK